MPVTAEGTIPYPQSADPAPLQQAAAAYTQLTGQLRRMSSTITSAVAAAKGGWSGSAATAWGDHLTNRATHLNDLADTLQAVPDALTTMAQAIVSTSSSYADAVQAEQTARQNLPQSIGSLLQALEEETAAGVSLQASGVACAAKVAATLVSLQVDALALADYDLGSAFQESLPSLQNILWGVAEELNVMVDIPLPGGSEYRVGVVSALLNAGTPFPAVANVVGWGLRAMESPLTLMQDTDGSMLAQLKDAGLNTQPTSVDDVSHNLALLEADRRTAGDQSAVILTTVGTQADGHQNFTVTMGGINPAGSLLPGDTGGRSGGNAAADKITGWGQQEQGLYDDIKNQGLSSGDTVNLWGHSQAGIVMDNVANRLAGEGYNVNLITQGSPETQLNPNVNAYIMQDNSDIVPGTRVGGASGLGVVLGPNQQVITSETDQDALSAHSPLSYASWADANSSNPQVQSMNNFIGDLNAPGNLTGVRSNITVLSGPGTPPPDQPGQGAVAPPSVTGTPVKVSIPPSPVLTH